MATMTGRSGLIVVVVGLVGVAATVTWAQGQAQPPGSLAGLTEEVRQLRLAVQDSAKTQAQIQAMTVYLSAQQSRLSQVSARLDKAHADLMAASAQTQRVAGQLAAAQAELPRAATPEERNRRTT